MAFFAGRKVLTSSRFGGAVVKGRGIWYLTGVQPMSIEDIKAQEQRKEEQEKKGGEQPSGEGKPPGVSKEATAPKKEGSDSTVVDGKQKKQ